MGIKSDAFGYPASPQQSVSGALLSFLALSFGVSGYSLPWDEIGFWALQVVSAVPETTDDFLPGVGSSIVCPIRGGFSIGQETLNRAFTAHTLTLPAGAAIVSLLHFLLIRKQSVSGPLWRCWRCHVDSNGADVASGINLGSVHPFTFYVSWVQNDVNQFGLYLLCLVPLAIERHSTLDGCARSATRKLPIPGENVPERQFTVIVSLSCLVPFWSFELPKWLRSGKLASLRCWQKVL